MVPTIHGLRGPIASCPGHMTASPCGNGYRFAKWQGKPNSENP
jgi:hypothetical protein